MKNTLGVVLLFLLVSALVLGVVDAVNNDILGPIVIWPSGNPGGDIQILTPQNNSTTNNPVQLYFCVHALAMLYQDFGQIGYSTDNGDIYEVKDFCRKNSQEQGDTRIGEFWANITLPNLTEGTHNITVYYGLQFTKHNPRYEVCAYSTVEFTVKNKDVTPPEITVESPTQNTTYTNEVQLVFTLNETATQVKYSIDGNENVSISGNNYNFTLADLPEGVHNITVYAQDQEANIGTSNTITFNITAPKPETNSIIPTITVTITALTIAGILFYFKKHKQKLTKKEKEVSIPTDS